jgi:hypothetical protein
MPFLLQVSERFAKLSAPFDPVDDGRTQFVNSLLKSGRRRGVARQERNCLDHPTIGVLELVFRALELR